MSAALDLSDPVYKKKDEYNPIDKVALSMINDPRDLPFVQLSLAATLVLIPFAIYMFAAGTFPWWIGVLYLAINLAVFMDRYILMLHNTSHRPLYKAPFTFLNQYIPAILGPLFGETPYTYFAHHIGMHHPENNLPEDLSSTMKYQRDSLPDFLMYWGEFFVAGLFELSVYHFKRKRMKLFWMTLLGEASWYAAVILLGVFVSWQATLFVLIIPFVLVRFLMMAGNWSQHAFIDENAPANPYRNSITCINTRYNRRCFNDGYHIGHHEKATRHWTDMPIEFQENWETYRDEKAIVFEGVDYFQIWMHLMARDYDWLFEHFVDLEDEKRSKEEVIALFKERLAKIDVSQYAAS